MKKKIDIKSWPKSFQKLLEHFSFLNIHLTFLAVNSNDLNISYNLILKLNKNITITDLVLIKNFLSENDVFFDYIYTSPINEDISEEKRKTKIQKYDLQKNDVYINKNLIFYFINSKSFNSKKPISIDKVKKLIEFRHKKIVNNICNFLSGYSEKDLKDDHPMKFLLSKLENQITFFIFKVDEQREKLIIYEDYTNEKIIEVLKKSFFYKNQIKNVVLFKKQKKPIKILFSNLRSYDPNLIHPALIDGLFKYKNLSLQEDLYVHQVKALNYLIFNKKKKKNLVLTTSTGSGKSLVYQISVLNQILYDISNSNLKSSTAFFIFPTKALAVDQKYHLVDFLNCILIPKHKKIVVETFDGDTSFEDRSRRCETADIIFTNPDILHTTILQSFSALSTNNKTWFRFISNLKFVVLDEIHVYKGIFGINVSFVITRLKRIFKIISSQSHLTFIGCSATILNPISHFKSLCGITSENEIIHIYEESSPSNEQKLVSWDPGFFSSQNSCIKEESLIDRKTDFNSLKIYQSSILDLARILLTVLTKFPKVKGIVFCTVRKVCELVFKEVKTLLKSDYFLSSTLDENEIVSYRGGYTKSQREEIQKKIIDGKVRAVISTNALELGIDVSDLNLVISCGFPLLKLNLHQQFGRVGRNKNSNESLAIVVFKNNPLDHYFFNNFNEICKMEYENLLLDDSMKFGLNYDIIKNHLQCFSYEQPVDIDKDFQWFSNKHFSYDDFVTICKKNLIEVKGLFHTKLEFLPNPASLVSLRKIEDSNFSIFDITNNKSILIEEIEELRVNNELYLGAIILHQGCSFIVIEIDFVLKFAKVKKTNTDCYTKQRDYFDIDPVKIIKSKKILDKVNAYYGNIKTTSVLFGYYILNKKHEILETVDVDNPPIISFTKGVWLEISTDILRLIEKKNLSISAGIHAAEHAIMKLLPLFINNEALCSSIKLNFNIGETEIFTECKAPEKEFSKTQTSRLRPAVLIFYDSKGKDCGNGMSKNIFKIIEDLLNVTYLNVKNCNCEWGCINCVLSHMCREKLIVISKPASILILGSFIKNLDIYKSENTVSNGPERNIPISKVKTITY